jgi:hypothetical protein
MRRQRGYVIGESIDVLAPLERLGGDVLLMPLVGKDPAQERVSAAGLQLPKLLTEPGIRSVNLATSAADRRGSGASLGLVGPR